MGGPTHQGLIPQVDFGKYYIYPLKLHEYLAAGRPVVSASIQTLLDFKHVVSLAGSVDEWNHVHQALAQYDWEPIGREDC
ncbi:MAG: hypothetical protein L0Y67_06235 [Gammaproteobacteria bacterium]|nr:hypothetical protein [Gammaproteobacteria bacterium]